MATPRTAIVTGGSRGIGRAIAVALGGEGMQVVVNYHQNEAAARECAAGVEQAGGRSLIVQADIGSAEGREKLVGESVGRFSSIELLVNNAGVAPKVREDLLKMNEDSFDEVMNTNLKGPFFLSQLVARQMLGQPAGEGRAIVNIGSVSAYAASVNRGEYCIAKAGVGMMTKLFATRLAEHGINVYEVRPGIIATDMTASETVKARYDKLILEGHLLPLRRWGQPADVAQAVVAIARGLFPYSTGLVLDVDGGFHFRQL